MKLKSLIPAVAAIAMLAGCAQPQGKKVAIVYFSQTGNTKIVAEAFAETLNNLTDSDEAALFNAKLFPIEPATAYPDTYEATIEEAREECVNDAERPVKKPVIKGLEDYDIVFVGYPVWYGTYAPVIKTFCKANGNLAGKKIIPFCTYGSGGRISSTNNLKALCREAEFIDSYGIADSRLDEAKSEISVFVASIAKALLCDGENCKAAGRDDKCEDECCKNAEEGHECNGERCKKAEEGHECNGECCSGCNGFAELTEQDSILFNTAIQGYTKMDLTPVSVKKAELVNATHVFQCHASSPLGQTIPVDVYVLAPVDGSKPVWTAIER